MIEAPNQVSDYQLQKTEVLLVSESRHADDGQRAGFRRHNGERDRPPCDLLVREEVVFQRALVLAKAQAERRHSGQVDDDDGEIDGVQAHPQLFSRVE